MTGGEDHAGGVDFTAVGCDDTADLVIGDEQIDDLGEEAHFAAGVEDRGANGLDDVGQEIGADVRMGVC